MHVTEITVHAGRTFNNPYESYSNFKPGVSITALLDPGDDFETAVKFLQAKAESLAEEIKAATLGDLQALQELRRRQGEEEKLRRQLKQTEQALDALRREMDEQVAWPAGLPRPIEATAERANFDDHVRDDDDDDMGDDYEGGLKL